MQLNPNQQIKVI